MSATQTLYGIRVNGRLEPFPLPRPRGYSRDYDPGLTRAFERRSYVKKWAEKMKGEIIKL